ncbi:hypothetical protein BS78_05G198600 [Paspalum vaginatum]|nr:hypothetical protein BS78_05G198600 [Paspalum vaginatum]
MILILLLLILGFALAPMGATAEPWYTCGTTGSYTANSTYQKNMELLSAMLPTNASTSVFDDADDGSSTARFAKVSVGAVPNTVYGLALCRDLNGTACRACITTAFQGAGNLCGLSKEATMFDDMCLRFSDQDFLDLDHSTNPNALAAVVHGAIILMNITKDPMFPGWGDDDSQDLQIFDHVKGLLNGTINKVPRFHRPTKHYAGMVNTAAIHGHSSSIPPNFSDRAMAHFSGRQRGRVLGVWCSLRYGATKFYSSNATTRKTKDLVIALVVPLLVLFLCIIVSIRFLRRHIKVSEATDNFSEENKLGQGGFGPVYKGRFSDGVEIAVKRLIASRSGQGFKEFKNEIRLIAKLQHTNLVRLLGCCCQGGGKMLIYEYLPNKSLDFFIFDGIRKHLIDWNKRSAIIYGIAQGLLYLDKHSRLRVIHRDLKASNILLNCEMNPKISDFGLAKAFSSNDTEGNTRRIVGTYGYMAPDYASEGLFSIKSYVYSFGVLILEIVSGKKPSSFYRYGDFINLPGHACQQWKDDRWLQLVDTSLVAECHTPEIMRCINIALLCVQENAADRPTMSDVVAMLSSETMTLSDPKHPAYFNVRVTHEEASTAIEPYSHNDVTISSIDAR